MKTTGRGVLFLVTFVFMIIFTNACATTELGNVPLNDDSTAIPSVSKSVTPSDIAWIIGTWKGDQAGGGFAGSPSILDFTFSIQGDSVTWDLVVTQRITRPLWAVGIAKIIGNQVTLSGYFISGPVIGNVSYSLTRNQDVLEGMGISSSSNVPVRVSLIKISNK